MQSWEEHLARWQSGGVVDSAMAERIRAFEAVNVRPEGQRWQVLVALILGGILLGAGVLLFVAAHWDEVSPGGRFVLVLALLAVFHLAGALVAERFPAMATVLHGVGTVGAGGAIAMVGQIFNMQEHWPSAILLWALCAAAGWWYLRDQFQQVWLMLLIPAWMICEWSYWASGFQGYEVYLARMLAAVGVVYLTGFIHSRREVVFGVLFGVGGLALMVAVGMLSAGWAVWGAGSKVPVGLRVASVVVMAVTVAAGGLWQRRSVVPSVAVVVMVFALPWLRAMVKLDGAWRPYEFEEPSVAAYLLVAAVSMVLVWWGVRERSRAVVNYGIAAFGMTVAWFYFSSLMDKLGRSLGLIGLGLLFLLGGWALERFRRRLMVQVRSEPSAEATA